jgi:O-antigen/teichoic acid export membrane protein
MFAELGFAVSLVQAPQVSVEQRRMAATLLLLLNLAVAALIVLLAPWVAAEYGAPEVAAVMRTLTLELLLASLSAVPLAMLERELRFRAISIVQIAAGLAGSLATLVSTLADLGVWALVAGALTLASVRTIGILLAFGGVVWPGPVQLAAIQQILNFSGHTLVGRLLWYAFGQADSLVLGLQLNTTALGVYNTSAQLAMLPASKAMEAVNRVAFPVLCRLVDQIDEMRLMADRLRRMLSLYGFGVCWGLAAVAPELVLLLLGEKWRAAQWPLAALALVTPLRMLSAFHNSAAMAAGQPQAATRELAVAAVLVPAAVAVGAWQGGLAGASAAWLVAYPAVFALSLVLTSRVLRQRRRQALATMVAPALAGLAMLAAVRTCHGALAAELGIPALLAVEIGVGAATYLGALWLGARQLMLDALQVVGDVMRPARAA